MIALTVANATEGVWMTPEFPANQAAPKGERARVRIKPLTGREKLKMDHDTKLSTKLKAGSSLVADFAKREWEKQLKTLESNVVGLENWAREIVHPDGTKTVEAITDTKVWLETLLAANAAHLAVLDQVYNAILDVSTLEASVEGE